MGEKGENIKINEIAGKEISNDIQQVVCESEEISSEILKTLLFYACNPTHIALITYARNCLSQLPAEWLCVRIKELLFQSENIYDDWEYRRFLELSEIIAKELLDWAVSIAKFSTDPEIVEAAEEFKSRRA